MNNIINYIIITISIIIFIILLNLYIFISVNPSLKFKGKGVIMLKFKKYTIPYIFIDKNDIDHNILKKLNYSIIFKPNTCGGFANEVKLINNYKEAIKYIKNSKDRYIIVQEYDDSPFEGTIYYIKNPKTKEVRIIVSERVIKSGHKIWTSSKSYKFDNYTIHRPELETTELRDKIIQITNLIPDFYFGRYDIKFKSHDLLKHGKGFKIIELNSQFSTDTRYDVKQSKTYNIKVALNLIGNLYKIGLYNIIRRDGCNINTYINNTKHIIYWLTRCNHGKNFANVFRKFDKIFKKN